jgi:hypothetical protein
MATSRTIRFLGLLVLIVLVLGGGGASRLIAAPAQSPERSVIVSNDKSDDDDNGKNRGDDKGSDRGNKEGKGGGQSDQSGANHENDDDGDHDHSGPNRGNEDEDDRDENDLPAAVQAAEPYGVNVSCTPHTGANQTTCRFQGFSPRGDPVLRVDIPTKGICSAVLATDAEYAGFNTEASYTSYRLSQGSGAFSLVFDGQVLTGALATYRIQTDHGLYPAKGAELVCATDRRMLVAQPPAPTATAVPTKTAPRATPVAATGSVVVEVFDCSIATPAPEFDWFGSCKPAGAGVQFQIGLPGAGPDELVVAATGATGQVRFERLEPAAYELLEVDGSWCHAESDSVEPSGEVLVRGDEIATVWIFHCTGSGS